MNVTIVTKVRSIFLFFQKFKLFFHENNVFNFFVETFHGKIEPYVVVCAEGVQINLFQFFLNELLRDATLAQK